MHGNQEARIGRTEGRIEYEIFIPRKLITSVPLTSFQRVVARDQTRRGKRSSNYTNKFIDSVKFCYCSIIVYHLPIANDLRYKLLTLFVSLPLHFWIEKWMKFKEILFFNNLCVISNIFFLIYNILPEAVSQINKPALSEIRTSRGPFTDSQLLLIARSPEHCRIASVPRGEKFQAGVGFASRDEHHPTSITRVQIHP